jgi:hypothetical protein
MYLREMKKLTKVFLLVIFPLCVCAQSNTFRSNLNNQFADISDSIIYNSDTTQYLSIKPWFNTQILSCIRIIDNRI